jgi:hypothetical protein
MNSTRTGWYSGYGKWAVSKLISLEAGRNVATNQSEGFNSLLKSLQGWVEVPLDVIVLSLHMLQRFYLTEIRRGRAGIGSYILRATYEDYGISVDEMDKNIPVCTPDDIVASLQQKTYITGEEEQPPLYSNAKYTRATEIRLRDAISYSAKLGIFTVVGDTKDVATVTIFPKEACSCAAKSLCHHILAVKLSLKMEVEDTASSKTSRNLTTLRKNARGTKAKPGRKRPR